MKRILIFLTLGLSFPTPAFPTEWVREKLPPILEEVPKEPYEVLSPVGAGKGTVEEARLQTQREAIKVDADAIIQVICTPGHIRREWLTFVHENAYCRGKAIHFLNQAPKN